MSNHIGARRCFICQISTVQGPRRRNSHFIRSYLLTENYIATHPNIMIYAQSLFGDRQSEANMFGQRRVNDAVHWYMGELGARVVAESGRACDRYHLGKLILQGLKDDPEFTLQIDGATGKSETNGSVMKRSVRCAEAFSALGLKCGDVIVLMAPNHLDLCIPFYAGLYLGLAVAPIDRTLIKKELEHIFLNDEPKIVFCQSERARDVRTALSNCKIEATVVTFDEKTEGTISFEDFLKKYGRDTKPDHFKPADFDPEETIAFLVSTSGSTGLPKQTIGTHKNWAIGEPYANVIHNKSVHTTLMCMMVSPLQWSSAIIQFQMSPIIRFTRLQSSKNIDCEHAYDLINTYKPTFMLISPTMMATLMKTSKGKCDWTCFDDIMVGGGTVSEELLEEIRESNPNGKDIRSYGMSEITSVAFMSEHVPVSRSCGKPIGILQYRLVDVDTNKDVLEPNLPGELWLKGPSVSKGYYKNAEASRAAFAEDGWFKTGDMFYRDEKNNYFFYERIKLLLKYRNHQVSPAEIQQVIMGHPGVLDVAVTGIPDYECGDLPVACVVRRPGCHVTAQEIKDLVKDNLTDTKQLRGGVIFLDALPMTAGGKVDNKKIKKLVLTAGK